MTDVKKVVDEKIKGKKVMVFSKTYCPYCKMAKNALNNYGLTDADYEVWEIENERNCGEIQDYLNQITGGRSVPRVFINGEFIGGGDETMAMHKSGALKAKLA